MRRHKEVWHRVAQRNRLFSKFAGPESGSTSSRNKARIFRVLFDNPRRRPLANPARTNPESI